MEQGEATGQQGCVGRYGAQATENYSADAVSLGGTAYRAVLVIFISKKTGRLFRCLPISHWAIVSSALPSADLHQLFNLPSQPRLLPSQSPHSPSSNHPLHSLPDDSSLISPLVHNIGRYRRTRFGAELFCRQHRPHCARLLVGRAVPSSGPQPQPRERARIHSGPPALQIRMTPCFSRERGFSLCIFAQNPTAVALLSCSRTARAA